MQRQRPEQRLSVGAAGWAYISVVVLAGGAIVAYGIRSLLQAPPSVDLLWLALLTLLSGLLPVKLPKVKANISVSETFVFCGSLLFGAYVGALLGFLDVALMWTRLLVSGRVAWHRMLFSTAANPLSIWISASVMFRIADTAPLWGTNAQPLDFSLILGLIVFAVLYFLLNSCLIAVAIAFEERVNPIDVWTKHFARLSLNYWAGASVAALLVSFTRSISAVALLVIAPLMLIFFFTFKWSTEKVEKAEKHLEEMKNTFLRTIEALALAIDAKDQVTHGHIRRVQRFTMALARSLGMSNETQLDALHAAALLHDTGKLAVPEYILNKPGPLTASEFERMKLHATVGADILKSIDFPYPVEPIVRHHHENWDGSGYPDGIAGKDIPLGARILSVVDCYDALTSDRPYRPRYSRQHAEQVLRERRGVMYDPWVVDEFLRIVDKLEREELDRGNQARGDGSPNSTRELAVEQLNVINATTAEEREFNELRRELPRAASLTDAADIVFRHLRRVVPAAAFAMFVPKPDTTDLAVVACTGIGAASVEGLRIPIGERISGWAFAHKQVVHNSNAALELGPVASGLAVPLKYALAVPIVDGALILGVITFYSSNPFDNDHKRMLESAATIFASSVPSSSSSSPEQRPSAAAEQTDIRKPSVH